MRLSTSSHARFATASILALFLSIFTAAPTPADEEGFFNFDDCGTLYNTSGGCLVFYPDHHPGYYYLQSYGSFTAGDRVHVSGEHSPYFFCPCNSRCIQSNSITEGCSVPCSWLSGDITNDGRINIADAAELIRYIFDSDSNLPCLDQADCNENGRVEIGDVTCLIYKIF